MRMYTVLLSAADRDTLVDRLDADGFTHYSEPFKTAIPVILDSDPDDQDPRGYGLQLRLTEGAVSFYQDYLVGLTSLQTMNMPWKCYSEKFSALNIPEEHHIEAFLALQSPPLRRPRRFLPAFGTAQANGNKTGQATDTTRILVDQWSSLIRIVNMDTVGFNRFQIRSPGLYDCGIKLRYETTGVTFGLQLTLWRGGDVHLVGSELQTSDGFANPAEKNFPQGQLQTGDEIGLTVRSSAPSSFKITFGHFRLRKLGAP